LPVYRAEHGTGGWRFELHTDDFIGFLHEIALAAVSSLLPGPPGPGPPGPPGPRPPGGPKRGSRSPSFAAGAAPPRRYDSPT
jgi:hypothetical protein